MKILNTLSGKKEEFKPFEKERVKIYVCGPTVYDHSHIGHARTYMIFDVITKYLKYSGYETKYVMNITDIEDRIIKRAREENKTPEQVARFFENEFMEDMKTLNIDSVDVYARATDHIPQIINQIKTLTEKGYAYEIKDDGIYFDISKFADYGKLAKRTVEQAEDAVSRIDESIGKKNKGDFALWKLSKPGEPKWEGLLGKGRPGWHIEDTAIFEKHLGWQSEIHGGAQDLIFPHHEAEIAQMESISGKKPFVKYWLHSGFVTIEGRKMSKSLANFITIRDLLKTYSPQALRFMIVSSHYRSPIDYKEDLIKQSQAAIQRINEFICKLSLVKGNHEDENQIEDLIARTKEKIIEAMDDDFNTPVALAELFSFIGRINELIALNQWGENHSKKAIDFIKNIDGFLGILGKEEIIPQNVGELVEQREKLRKEKNFTQADKLRKQINSLGYFVEDTPYGPLIKKL